MILFQMYFDRGLLNSSETNEIQAFPALLNAGEQTYSNNSSFFEFFA